MSEPPFQAFITNLGKYVEGALVGEWMNFPTTPENLQAVFARIGIDGKRYEEWFITDYKSNISGLAKCLGEHESLDELNYLASLIAEMDDEAVDMFAAAVAYGEYTGSAKDLINLSKNLDCFILYPNVNNYDDLGRLLILEMGAGEVPKYLIDYIDYEEYGEDVAINEGGRLTDKGYIVMGGDFTEYYDGKDIPDEYRLRPRRPPPSERGGKAKPPKAKKRSHTAR